MAAVKQGYLRYLRYSRQETRIAEVFTGEPRLGIPYGARTEREGRQHVKELHAGGVHFVKI